MVCSIFFHLIKEIRVFELAKFKSELNCLARNFSISKQKERIVIRNLSRHFFDQSKTE